MLKFVCWVFIISCCFPSVYAQAPTYLSLNEAILIAVSSHPNVESSKLSLAAQKFNTYVQRWEFYPHYFFKASAVTGPNNSIISPSVSLLTPIGTQFNFNLANTYTNHMHLGLSLQIMQPLMRGFGSAIVEAALNNAKDSETISRLQVEGTLRNTITTVINAYLNVLMAQRLVIIDEAALYRANKSVQQTHLFIKAGAKARNELVTVKANVASAYTQMINDRNNFNQARYALLTAIGLDPNANIHFTPIHIIDLVKKYNFPSLKETKQRVLDNNIQYQIDRISIHGPTSRNLLIAKDNNRWSLNLTANANAGSGSGGLFNGINRTSNVGLLLQIPIDDQRAKQAVVNAKIALEQAELALLQEKWRMETDAINGWNTVISAKLALQYSKEAEKLQKKTYQVSYQKYLHGLIDSLELQSAQIQLIQAQQILLNAEINYLKSLANLDFLLGSTLKTWDIKVRNICR